MPSAHAAYGIVLIKTRRLHEALIAFQHATDVTPTSVEWLIAYAGLAAEMRRVEPAFAAAKRAVVAAPQSAVAHGALARVYGMKGQFTAARDEYLRARELNPQEEDHLGMAAVHACLGNAAEATRHIVELRKQRPKLAIMFAEAPQGYFSTATLSQ